MALETATYISDLVSTNPVVGDDVGQGDDHLRLLKTVIKATFPNVTGAVSPTHTELNYVDGVTSAIQTQLDAKGALAGATWTGTQNFTGATVTVPTVTANDNDTSAASTAQVGLGRWFQLGTTQTISGTPAAVDFINGTGGVVMDSTYEMYLFELIAVLPSADAVSLLLRTTTDATTFDTSGYVGALNYTNAGASNPMTAASGTTSVSLTGTPTVGTVAGEQGVYGHVLIYKPSDAARCHIQWDVSFRESSASTYMTRCVGIAVRDTPANVDGVRFLPSASTLASGTIRMYGRTK